MNTRTLLSLLVGAALTVSVGNVSAWWGGGWNPYDPWDPRYWAEEFFGGNGWGNGWGGYGGPWGGYGGPWGGYGYPYYGGGYYGGYYPHYGGGWGAPYYSGWGYGYTPYATTTTSTQSKPKSAAKSAK